MKKVMTYGEKKEKEEQEKQAKKKIEGRIWRLWEGFLSSSLICIVIASVNILFCKGNNLALRQLTFWFFSIVISLGIIAAVYHFNYIVDRRNEKKGYNVTY